MEERNGPAPACFAENRIASLSLVIPAYNEAAGIAQAVAEADAALANLAINYEILVVDDGSTDATSETVLESGRTRSHVRLLRHPVNRGYGAALRTGFQTAQFERVAFTDADGQFDLTDLSRLARPVDQADLVVGYRAARQDPWLRRFYSWSYNRLVRLLLGTGVRDCDCALKVYRKEALARLLPETSGFFVNTEMLTRARQLHLRVEERPVRHRPRLRGASKVSLSDIPRTLAALLPFWWSRVLFPRSDSTNSQRSPVQSGTSPLLLVVLVFAALLFFWHLDSPLQEPDEARYAEVPRQMLAESHWLVPVLQGQPYYDKPPLFYWLVMISYRLFGVHDWAARLASSGSAFLVVPVVWWWGRRMLGARAALAGSLILAPSSRFVYLGRLLTPDSPLALCVVGMLATGHLALTGSRLRRGWWVASAVCCGLGILTKGPVAFILGAVPLFLFQLLDLRAVRPSWQSWGAYLLVIMGIACPWFIAIAAAEPSFLEYFFWKHNVLRFFEPFDHAEPFWFHLPGLLLGMLPWTLLLPGLVRHLFERSPRVESRRPAALGFFLLAGIWGLLFYSLSGCKRAVYILPVIPPFALALGCYLDQALPRERLLRAGMALVRRGSRLAHAGTLLMLGLGAVGALAGVQARLLPVLGGGTLAVVALISFGALWRCRNNPSGQVSWAACAATTFMLLFVTLHQLQPSYAGRFSLRGVILPHAPDAHADVACYPRQWDSISFYLGRSDIRAYGKDERQRLFADLQGRKETLLFVKSGTDLDVLLRELPESLEFVCSGLPGIVTAGKVRPRMHAEGDDVLLAKRK